FVEGIPFAITGTAAPNAQVSVAIENAQGGTTADNAGHWELTWTAPLNTGVYTISATSNGATATADLRVQLRGRLPRQSTFEEKPLRYGEPELPNPDAAQEMTDRWRIAPPPYELDEHSRGKYDPYNKNRFKGDYPFRGDDWFLVLTGISDSLAESRTLPTPSGPSSARPSSFPFFGDDDQGFFAQNVIVSADLFQGNTAFKPVTQRIKATIIGNFTHLRVEENGVVKPDVRRGTRRSDSHFSLQEIFYERKLRDLSPNYDFVSFRAGSQPFQSDFRGFIFSDTNTGVRLFGNLHANRWQYNVALFDRLEKDTNSGLNTLYERRDQQVAIANAYFQDFFHKGYTQQFSVHLMHDDGGVKYDRNGTLVRPAPVGDAKPHSINAAYLGEAGLGHIGRFNIDQAAYFVFGRDSLNPIAGPDPELRDRDSVRIGAAMAAVEVSYDRDWLRPRFALFYATGDRNPRDRNARGFDSIFDATAFAGGGFSFFNRLGIRLAQTGVALVERGSLLPSLRSSKDEGQPNYVNPGLQLASIGLDVDVTPRLKAIFTANHIRLDATEPLEEILFQGDISKHLGEDISLGMKYRPLLSNNVTVVGGVAAFKPGQGFKDIYESGKTLYHFFMNITVQF
ncbi:MAG TPA: hypothetical protein VMU84_07135, partial [Thermoanaerobaculia bacterium]|nr:hypothetical protein [Thermoanaerobaculia bacterium]